MLLQIFIDQHRTKFIVRADISSCTGLCSRGPRCSRMVSLVAGLWRGSKRSGCWNPAALQQAVTSEASLHPCRGIVCSSQVSVLSLYHCAEALRAAYTGLWRTGREVRPFLEPRLVVWVSAGQGCRPNPAEKLTTKATLTELNEAGGFLKEKCRGSLQFRVCCLP